MSDVYEAVKQEVKAEQSGKDYEEIKQEMQRRSEFMVELDSLGTQKHLWIDRGTVMSCENAGHANHHAFKIRR